MTLIIEADRLSRSFGAHRAVGGLSLAIPPGEIFGLLGPNGAGKTTTIKMLATLLPPSGGTARVWGSDVVRAAGEVRSRVGYVMAMPGWMEAVARANPLTYAIEAIRLLVLEGWSGGVTVSLGALVAASAVLLAVGAHQVTRQTRERIA
ncbi:MAG TPA: ATP-binding cassette domain-containing protein [Nonomuraea sp.]|nr:ATP-binding cassette domain-containing protein [Nonomuraea sp.]